MHMFSILCLILNKINQEDNIYFCKILVVNILMISIYISVHGYINDYRYM